MNQYIHISKFSTLNFEPENRKSWEDQVDYCQKLHYNDAILLQFAADSGETFSYSLVNSIGTIVRLGSFTDTVLNSYIKMHELTLSGLAQDIYTLQIYQTTVQPLLVATSSPFIITDSVENMALLTYTNQINEYDTIFINGTVRVFNFRFEGGFLNDDTKYMVEANSFRNQYQENRQLYQMPYKTQILTIGNAFGVPDWVAEKINFIFCCSNVYLNRVKHVRSEKEVPVRSIISEGYPFSNFKLTLEGQPELYTTGMQIFTSDWIAQKSAWKGYGTWINNGIFNRN